MSPKDEYKSNIDFSGQDILALRNEKLNIECLFYIIYAQ